MSASTRLEAPRNIFRTVDTRRAFARGRGRIAAGAGELPPHSESEFLGGGRGLQRPVNSALRAREYLTPSEVEKLMGAARNGRYGHRDATLILVAYRHGLRASEIADLEWSQVELGRNATLHVRRAKNGRPSAHPLRGDEVRALRELHRQSPDSAFAFVTERGGPFTPDAINRLIKRIGARARFAFPVHAHMLRHALRLCARQLRTRHAANSRLAGPSLDSAHDEVHAIERGAIQGLLEVGG